MKTRAGELPGRTLARDDLETVATLTPDGVVARRATHLVGSEADELDGGVAAAGRLYRLADLLFGFEDEHSV